MPAPALDASRGREVALVFESYLSPWQESNEEENTPSTVPAQFRSTTPSQSRAVEGVDVSKVNMFHIHCGKPGVLGPIIVDFALLTDIKQNLADGVFSVELTDDVIAKTMARGEGKGLVEGFTRGCVIGSPSLESMKPAKVLTIAGLAHLAAEHQLYFNLHTTRSSGPSTENPARWHANADCLARVLSGR